MMIQIIDFTVIGDQRINCAGCEQRIGNALRRLSGVKDVQASAATQRVAVTIDPTHVSRDQLRAKLEQLGYAVTTYGSADGSESKGQRSPTTTHAT